MFMRLDILSADRTNTAEKTHDDAVYSFIAAFDESFGNASAPLSRLSYSSLWHEMEF